MTDLTKTCEFEADLTPAEIGIGAHWPRVRFNFDNGWSASLVIRTTGCNAMQAALACCPTGKWGSGVTELEIGEQEATADEAIAFLSAVAAWEPTPPA